MKAKLLIAGTLAMAMFGATQAAAGNSGVAAFEQLKALVGHWQTEKSNTNQATLDVQLTSGGTAVIEKAQMVEQGKTVEMITLYYLDGDQLKLTHYCMAGNQPTMAATYDASTKTMKFDFVSATNLKSPKDGTCTTLCTRSLTTIISRQVGPSRRIKKMRSRKKSPTSA
jgi:hypothetical protein